MSLTVQNLHFSYGPIKALDDVSLSLEGGAAGLLGPNGAGKTTLIKILLGFLRPQKGEGRVLGYDIRSEQKKLRRLIGYMPEDDCFLPGMDAVTFTAFFGELAGMPKQEAMKRAHEVLFYVGLGEARYRLLDTYSAGMRQRLKLAQALVHDPKLLFLDEPTSNLDPQGRVEVLELIKDLANGKGIQILLSSHILSDIEMVCEDVVILNRGKVVAQGKIKDLKRMNFRLYELKIKGEREKWLDKLSQLGCLAEVTEDGLVKLYLPGEVEPKEIFKVAYQTGIQIRHFRQSQSSLEDFFAQVVGVD
ncbi:MAG: ABC transporter ATP-binding protein [Candidatus Aminicenantes bacterium]|nr:ABC transporter ATP-binding protein [Candidatus Aminicenantes bacterium]